mmetsp:Transcript_41807/g.133411  ORF Transcript_41807/g.133411 Transcript_41807/m.133411 type:complete len:210 (+) Transcript_41807:3-632(+)
MRRSSAPSRAEAAAAAGAARTRRSASASSWCRRCPCRPRWRGIGWCRCHTPKRGRQAARPCPWTSFPPRQTYGPATTASLPGTAPRCGRWRGARSPLWRRPLPSWPGSCASRFASSPRARRSTGTATPLSTLPRRSTERRSLSSARSSWSRRLWGPRWSGPSGTASRWTRGDSPWRRCSPSSPRSRASRSPWCPTGSPCSTRSSSPRAA